MTQGRGLESLIPKKNNQKGNNLNPNDDSDSFGNQNNNYPLQNNPDWDSQPQPQQQTPQEPPIYYPPQENSQPDQKTVQDAPGVQQKEADEPTPFQIEVNQKPQVQPQLQDEAKQFIPEPDEAIFQIEVDQIKPNPYQPRKEHNEEELNELARSIREVGIIQPLVVSKFEEDTESGTRVYYQLISGERRLRAAKIAGLKTVPVIVRREQINQDKLYIALIENLQRVDLNSIETARAYARLQDNFNLTQREIATRVGKSRESISNTIRLLNLPTNVQDAISTGKVSESQGRVLLSVKNPTNQERLFQKLLKNNISARKLHAYAHKLSNDDEGGKSHKNKLKNSSQETNFWEHQIEEKLGIPVSISRKGNKSKLIFNLFTQGDWDKLINKLLGK